MEKKNHSCNKFEVGTANRQDVANLLGVRCQDKERRVFRIHSTCVFDSGWSEKRENRSMQTLSEANCTKAKIGNMVQLLHLVYLPSLFPRLEHVSIPLRLFVWFLFLFLFCAESNKFCILRSVTQLIGLYSDYYAGSFWFSPLGESITNRQSNQERIFM